MLNYTRDEIMEMAEEEDVEFIRLQFTDMFGIVKNIAITVRELPRALNNECMVNGSFIAGMADGRDADLYLHPDLDTFTILPWRPQQGKVARMICDVYCEDGTPYTTSSRYILQQIVKKAAKQGYICLADPECEFFLFHTDDNGMPTTVSHEKAGYLDISPLDLGGNARRDMVLTLEDMGIEVRSSLHEAAPAQHEIDFRPTEIGKMGDVIMTFKMAVKTIAKRHGLHATFMPKPKTGEYGSGMHVRFSLMKDGKNIFADPDTEDGFSKEAYYFAGGLLKHSREMALITNPIVNSYKRLVPGFEAPSGLFCSMTDTNAVIRPAGNRGRGRSIEFQSPDASTNPYLVFAVCLAAGLDGINNQIEPSFTACDEDHLEGHLPKSLKEAIDLFEASDWVKKVLGEEFCKKYLRAKQNEWTRYNQQVTQWEIENYLYRV